MGATREVVKKRTFDWKKFVATLADSSVATLSGALQEIRRSGFLILKTEDAQKAGKRDVFVQSLRMHLKEHAPVLIPVLENEVTYAFNVERGYHAILQTLREQDISSQTPSSQLWAAMELACIQIERLMAQVAQAISELDPTSFHLPLSTVKNKNGTDQNIDALVAIYATVLHSTILMLAWNHHWFEDAYVVIPPPPNEVNPETSVSNSYLASAWIAYEEADEYVRMFDGKLTCDLEEVDSENEAKEHIRVCRFQANIFRRKYETIARERLDARLLDWMMSLSLETDAELGIMHDLAIETPLPPAGYVSREEHIAERALKEIFYIDTTSAEEIVPGLTVAQMLRGYSVLQQIASNEAAFKFLPLSSTELTSQLKSQGLHGDQAEAFIRIASLSKGKRDLYDAPLIRDTNGSFWLFAPLIKSANLIHIVTSQAVALEAKLDAKGQPAELALRNILTSLGVPVSDFTYTEDGQHYQCDAALLWDDHLFVFELKNRLIPLGLSSEYSWHFWEKLREDSKQCQRIAGQLKERPELIKQKFGDNASFSVVHPILLQALPFSLPSVPFGAYVYDISALGRFVLDPSIVVTETALDRKKGPLQIQYRVGSLWSGQRPEPQDLLREMIDPLQVRVSKDKWSSSHEQMRLSEGIGAVIPVLRRRPEELNDPLRALGWTEEDIERFWKTRKYVSDRLMPLTRRTKKRRHKRR